MRVLGESVGAGDGTRKAGRVGTSVPVSWRDVNKAEGGDRGESSLGRTPEKYLMNARTVTWRSQPESNAQMPIRPLTQFVILAPALLQREAWRALLSDQPGIEVVGAIDDAEEVSPLLQSGQPTTVLIDLPAPQPELALQLKAAAPDLGLLFLVQTYELGEILPLLQAGATGCISRDDSVGNLARAIIAVGRGEIALPPHIAARALGALARGETGGASLIEALTDREVEVLQFLAQGLTNKDIAQTLFLSVRTVEAHLRNIYGKLNVRSRTEAVLWAVKHGYAAEE